MYTRYIFINKKNMRMFQIVSKEFHKNGYIKYKLPSFKSDLFLIQT